MINFTLEKNATGLSVTSWQPTSVTINGREYGHSIILTPEKVHNWAPSSTEELDPSQITELLNHPADVLILGTGVKQKLLDVALLSPFYRQGIGIEVMNSNAACHTFNILIAEGRRPVAGIIIET